ncbi:hypothetical protein SH611_10800 [Geminicoccaceae bacterium 1502E]|nr:hypothetical protein [Geminicoccaceae bacterium 1502E]
MAGSVIAWERIGELGELRGFVREGPPPHYAFEILQDEDGRAWTLRVPLAQDASLRRVLAAVAGRLQHLHDIEPDEEGCRRLAGELLGGEDELVALVMSGQGQERFALWRRERLGSGWSWTLDVVFAPLGDAAELCRLIEAALAQAREQMRTGTLPQG